MQLLLENLNRMSDAVKPADGTTPKVSSVEAVILPCARVVAAAEQHNLAFNMDSEVKETFRVAVESNKTSLESLQEWMDPRWRTRVEDLAHKVSDTLEMLKLALLGLKPPVVPSLQDGEEPQLTPEEKAVVSAMKQYTDLRRKTKTEFISFLSLPNTHQLPEHLKTAVTCLAERLVELELVFHEASIALAEPWAGMVQSWHLSYQQIKDRHDKEEHEKETTEALLSHLQMLFKTVLRAGKVVHFELESAEVFADALKGLTKAIKRASGLPE